MRPLPAIQATQGRAAAQGKAAAQGEALKPIPTPSLGAGLGAKGWGFLVSLFWPFWGVLLFVAAISAFWGWGFFFFFFWLLGVAILGAWEGGFFSLMAGGGGWWPLFFLPLTCGADSFFLGGLGAFRWGRFIFPYTPWLGGADRDGGRGGGFTGAARGD